MTVLVVGATGRLGSRVARRLRDEDVPVRATSRDPSRLADLAARGAEPVRCDLRDRASVDAAVQDVTAVVHASHALVPPSRRNPSAVVDGTGLAGLIDAAARVGVEQFVLSSVTGARADHPVAFERLKWQAEQQLESSGLPHTVLRLAAFAETHALQVLGEPIRRGARVTLVGPGTAPRNLVSADDAATVAVDAVRGRAPSDEQVLTVVGPGTHTMREIAAMLEQALGTTARRRHVPAVVLDVVRRPVGWLHPGIGQLLHLTVVDAVGGDALDLAPRPGLVVGSRSLEEVVRAWAHDVSDPPG